MLFSLGNERGGGMLLPGWDSLQRVTNIGYALQVLVIVCTVGSLLYGKRRDVLQDLEHNRQAEVLRSEAASAAEEARADAERRVQAAQAEATRQVAEVAAEAAAALAREKSDRGRAERAQEAHRQNLAHGGNTKSELIWKDGNVIGNSVEVTVAPASATVTVAPVTAEGNGPKK